MNNLAKLKRVFILSSLILNLTLVAVAQNAVEKFSTEEDFKEDLKFNVCKNEERLEAVKKLFKAKGATEDDIKIEKFKNVENLVVTKKGKSEDTIVVFGAHYDKVSDGCGAIDNWTGIVIIANLYKSLRSFSTEKTYIFVAFGKEENGLLGSEAMAKTIPKEKRENYCSMINFDSFGFTYPQVLDNVSNSKMTKIAKEIAKEMNFPFSNASLEGTADADSASFLKREIPAITFHGLSNKWQEYLHSSKDKLENVNSQSVFIGYRFALSFLANVEKSKCNTFQK